MQASRSHYSIDVSASAPGIERRRVVWTCAVGGGRVRLANVPRGKGLGEGSSRAEGKRYARAIAHWRVQTAVRRRVSMPQWRGWWLAMLAGWSLLCLVRCSDSGLDDNASEAQTTTEPTITELGLRLAPPGFNVAGLSPAARDQV